MLDKYLDFFEANMTKYTLTAESYVLAAYVYAVILLLLCGFTWVFFGVIKAGKLQSSDAALPGSPGPPGVLEEVLRRRPCKAGKSKHEYEVAWTRTSGSNFILHSHSKSWHNRQDMVDWGFQKVVDRKDEEEVAMRRLSWILSCVNSFMLTAIGGVYCYYKLRRSQLPMVYSDLHCNDNVAHLVALWFAMFNAADLIFGTLMYPEQMDPITAYVHHPLFIYIMYASTTGHYGWNPMTMKALYCDGFAPVFLIGCVEELPTFILGFGSVFPAWRLDIGFGVSFFLLRVIFHGCILVQSFLANVHPLVTGLCCLTMVMHIFWFRGWVVSYLKKKPSVRKNADQRAPAPINDKKGQ